MAIRRIGAGGVIEPVKVSSEPSLVPTPTSWGSQDYPGAQSVMWAPLAGVLPGEQYPLQRPSMIHAADMGFLDGWSVPQGGVLGLIQAGDLASSEAATQRGFGGWQPSSQADTAAAAGFLGHRAARFASEASLGGADPSSTLASINSQAASFVVRGDSVSALALLSEPRTVAAARATGHLDGLHSAIGVLLGTTPVPAARGMGQDPFSAIAGAVGALAGSVPGIIGAVNAPKIAKQAAQTQESISQTQAQAQLQVAQAQAQSAQAQTQAWADSITKSAPYVGAGILGVGLIAMAVL